MSSKVSRREFFNVLAGGVAALCLNPVEALARKAARLQYISDVDRAVHEHIAELRRSGVLKTGDKTSVYVYGLHSDKPFVRINVDEQRMAASLIKPFVMLAAYHRLARGKKPPNSLEQNIRAMIVHSDNNATNSVLRFVGGPREANRIAQHYGFGNTRIVEYIPPGGRTYRNRTSARNLNALLWMLHKGTLISPQRSRQMLEHLDAYATSRIAKTGADVDLAGKTGFVGGLNGEAARVTYSSSTGPRHYNFIAIIENRAMQRASARKKQQWGHQTSGAIRSIFRVAHRHMTQ